MAITKYPTWAGAGTYVATVTAHASANTKGSYTQLAAATAEDIRGLSVVILGGSGNTIAYLVDIATGPAASETVVIADLAYCTMGLSANHEPVSVFIPISLAAGTRIAVRCQANVGGATVGVAVIAVGGASSATVATYGAQTSLSRPVDVDPGGSANTKGSYVALTAATSATFDWAIVILTGRQNGALTVGSYSLDIATGAAAAEVVAIPDVPFSADATTDLIGPVVFTLPLTVAAGTRLSARAASTVTDATDRLFCCQVLGVSNSGMNGVGGSGGGGSFVFIG